MVKFTRRSKKYQRKKSFRKARRSLNFKKRVQSIVTQKLTQKNRIPFKSAYYLQASTNGCSYGFLPPLFHGTDLWNIAYLMTGGTGGNLTANATTLRYYINEVTQTTNMTNQCLGNASVTMYYCLARNNIPNITNINTPIKILQKGFDAQTGGSPTGSAYASRYGVTPFESSLFCKYFKIYKVKKIMLAPGESYNVKVSSKRNKRIDVSSFMNDDSALSIGGVCVNYLRNLTKFILLKVEGQATNDSTTKTDVGTSSPKLDIVTRYHYDYSFISDYTANSYDDVVPNGFTAFATVTTPDLVTDSAIVADTTEA